MCGLSLSGLRGSVGGGAGRGRFGEGVVELGVIFEVLKLAVIFEGPEQRLDLLLGIIFRI